VGSRTTRMSLYSSDETYNRHVPMPYMTEKFPKYVKYKYDKSNLYNKKEIAVGSKSPKRVKYKHKKNIPAWKKEKYEIK